MNQGNMSTGNPTLDLLNQANGMNEFKAPDGNQFQSSAVSTGNPTLDLLNQSVQSAEASSVFGDNFIKSTENQNNYTEVAPTGNPTLDLLNQSGFSQEQTVSDIPAENPYLSQSQFVPMEQTVADIPVENPALHGNSQFLSVQPEVQIPVPPVQPVVTDIQAAAFGTPVNQPQMVQQSPEELFGCTTGTTEESGSFNPFNFNS
jgi:hypothetical protein